MKVVELPSSTLENVANVLRCIADRVESGDYGRPINAVVVLETEDNEQTRLKLFGAGAYNNWLRSLGLLYAGATQLASQHVNHPNAGTHSNDEA